MRLAVSSHKKQRSLHLFLVRTGSKYRFRVGDNKPKGSLFCACGSVKPPKAAFFVRLFQRCLVESCGWGACCGQGMFGSVCGAPVHSVDVCEARNVSQIHGMGRITCVVRRKLHKNGESYTMASRSSVDGYRKFQIPRAAFQRLFKDVAAEVTAALEADLDQMVKVKPEEEEEERAREDEDGPARNDA